MFSVIALYFFTTVELLCNFKLEMSNVANSVQVCVRVRPLNSKEVDQGQRKCVHFDESTNQVVLSAVDASHLVQLKGEAGRGYAIHKYYGPDSKSSNIYVQAVAPMIENVFKGFNGTVLAYGQTGSGKTHTMSGGVGHYETNETGITPLVIQHLFDMVDHVRKNLKPGEEVGISAAGVEIYNEELHDLSQQPDLSQSLRPRSTLKIQEVKQGKMRVSEIQGLQERKVETREELEQFFKACTENRATGATNMNERSSRSHALFTIYIHRVVVHIKGDKIRQETINSKLHLVDLAGSERIKRSGAQGQRLKEATNINQGLLALGNVIVALSDASTSTTTTKKLTSHIPYRDSKLTRILQDSLGGSSLTILLACISPAEVDFEETNNTLKYSNRACNIKNTPIPNKFITLDESLLPIIPLNGSQTMVGLTSALNSHFQQKKLKEKRELERLEKELKEKEQLEEMKKTQMRRAGYQRILSKEYDKKLREQVKSGKINFSKYQTIEGDKLKKGRPFSASAKTARVLQKRSKSISRRIVKRSENSEGESFTKFVASITNDGGDDKGYESDGSITEKIHRKSFKQSGEIVLSLQRSNSFECGVLQSVNQEHEIYSHEIKGHFSHDEISENENIVVVSTDGNFISNSESNLSSQNQNFDRIDSIDNKLNSLSNMCNLLNSRPQFNRRESNNYIEIGYDKISQSGQWLEKAFEEYAKQQELQNDQKIFQSTKNDLESFDLDVEQQLQENQKKVSINLNDGQYISNSEQEKSFLQTRNLQEIQEDQELMIESTMNSTIERKNSGITKILACLKINKQDIMCVTVANTAEDYEDIESILPNQTQLPGGLNMTFLIGRLLTNNSIDDLKADIQQGKSMRDSIGPLLGVLMATPGTQMISSHIFNFPEPQEVQEFIPQERIELWGLQIPHNKPMEKQQIKGEQNPPARWPSVDRLNMSIGLQFALCKYAQITNIKCGFCVPKIQLFNRWQQAGLNLKHVQDAKLVYPNTAGDYEYYSSSMVAYFIVDDVVQSLMNQMSLLST